MSTLLAPLIGILIGFFAAVPIGPLNAAVISNGLRGKVRPTVAMIIGGSIGDFAYCAATMLGISGVLADVMQRGWVRFAFGGAIIFFGLRILTSGPVHLETREAPDRFARVHGSFWVGFLISACNPMLVLSWIALAGAIHGAGWIGSGAVENIAFAVGASAGMASWLGLLLYLLTRYRERVPLVWLRRLIGTFGVFLVVFGMYCVLRGTGWMNTT